MSLREYRENKSEKFWEIVEILGLVENSAKPLFIVYPVQKLTEVSN